ncbi:type II toxin-antitoxin system RelE/ParE family toxin [Polymorphobacter multimanifer]|uniref:type II toxin-antitoxin system RelE/ParE family toxin n=1 Tax=Polymorphobacter multimanifer TaxID=1070431 RepID=UPI0016099F68
MLRLEFSRKAMADLDNIYRQSILDFDHVQADLYAGVLDAALRLILDHPMAGAVVTGRFDGLRRRNAGVHAIFYAADAECLRVIRILHQRMLPDLHL